MFVLERKRTDDLERLAETIELAGTTGNIYTVNISNVPRCTCPNGIKEGQCKHIIYVLVRVLKAPEDLRYQLAFLNSELRTIFAGAPPSPTDIIDDDTDGDKLDGRRKPIEDAEDCPICCIEFEPAKEKITWCRAACGNNMHQGCFEQWAAQKAAGGVEVTCPFCRTRWEGDGELLTKVSKDKGRRSKGGYVNIAAQLGISTARDTRTYHAPWVRNLNNMGRVWDEVGE